MFVYRFDSHTNGCRPRNRPTPPRNCGALIPVHVPVESEARGQDRVRHVVGPDPERFLDLGVFDRVVEDERHVEPEAARQDDVLDPAILRLPVEGEVVHREARVGIEALVERHASRERTRRVRLEVGQAVERPRACAPGQEQVSELERLVVDAEREPVLAGVEAQRVLDLEDVLISSFPWLKSSAPDRRVEVPCRRHPRRSR